MIEKIALQYRGRWLQGYARGKLHGDPIYAAAFELLQGDPRPVVDLGCGIGLFEFYLRERGFAGPLLGVDFDAKKIAQAQRIAAAGYASVRFEMADATAALPGILDAESGGHVVIFDLLHYLREDAQRPLLERVAASVAPGALCLIRATPRDESWRFRVTQFEEFFLRASRWMKSGAAHYSTIETITASFRARGYSIDVRPLWGRTLFNSHLFILRAPPLPA